MGTRENLLGLQSAKSAYPYIVHPCGCGSLACPICRKRRTAVIRDDIELAMSNGFVSGYMCTLTVNHDMSALDTYSDISIDRGVSEFMRIMRYYLGKFDWFSMFESQGNGYPHYHILMNIPFINFKFRRYPNGHKVLDKDGEPLYEDEKIGRMINALRKFWRWGTQIDFLHINNPKSTASYVTKYLSPKDEKHKTPDWVLKLPRFRFFSTSRGFWAKYGVRSSQSRKNKPDEENSGKLYNKRVNLLKRLDCCGSTINVFRCGKYKGTLKLTQDQLCSWFKSAVTKMLYIVEGNDRASDQVFIHYDRYWDFLRASSGSDFDYKIEFERLPQDLRYLRSCEDYDSPDSNGLTYYEWQKFKEVS